MDLFQLLGGGARFDKKRFKDDMELFKSESSEDHSTVKAATDRQHQSELLKELDFFKTSQSSNEKSKKRKAGDEDEPKAEETIVSDEDENDDVNPQASVEEASQFRKDKRIHVYGTDIPNPFRHFDDLDSSPFHLLPLASNNLKSSQYTKPTAIQMQSVPIILHGRDLIACAPTGSGKTLAYTLPIVHELKQHEKTGYRALIIAPTRELSQQIDRELRKLSAGSKLRINVLSKTTAADKVKAPQERKKFDILISTPLRLVYAIREGEVDLGQVRFLVLDEADKLLDGGFLEQTDEIFAACSNMSIRKSFFSATFTSTVEELAMSVMKNPIRVVVGTRNAATDTIEQKLVFTSTDAGKMVEVRQMIQEGIKPPVLIFVHSIDRAKQLFRELVYLGVNVEVIHSERTKAQRDQIIDTFRQGRIWVLIATDLMGRGLDFKGVNLVINYDIPQSTASYIHRIGRTGRAGRAGKAVTYFTREDVPYLRSIVNVMRESGCDVPEWMLNIKKPNLAERKKLRAEATEKSKKKKERAEAKQKKKETAGDAAAKAAK